MQLHKKKELARRVLGVGKERIIFNNEGLSELKTVLTRQDIRDLHKDKKIIIKEKTGRKSKKSRKTRRRMGSLKKKVNIKKRKYMILTRKLRSFILRLKKKGIISLEDYRKLRKEIRAKQFRSKSHMKERINQIINEKKGV